MQKERLNKQNTPGEEKKEGYIIVPNYFLKKWVKILGVGPVVLYQELLTYCHKGKLSLIHISEPTRLGMISYAVFCLKKKKNKKNKIAAIGLHKITKQNHEQKKQTTHRQR